MNEQRAFWISGATTLVACTLVGAALWAHLESRAPKVLSPSPSYFSNDLLRGEYQPEKYFKAERSRRSKHHQHKHQED